MYITEITFKGRLPVAHCQVVVCCDMSSVPVDIIKSVLSSSSRTSFHGFLSALAKSAALNDNIGNFTEVFTRTTLC